MPEAVASQVSSLELDGVTYCFPFHGLVVEATEEEKAALARSLEERGGNTVPVLVHRNEIGDWNVIDGENRIRTIAALKTQGKTVKLLTQELSGLSVEEQENLAVELNCQRRQYDQERKKEQALLLRGRGWSLRRVGARVGVSFKTVERWNAGVSHDTPADSEGADGKTYPGEQLSEEALWLRRDQVKELREEGCTLKEIAERLGVSEATVRNDIQALENRLEDTPEPKIPGSAKWDPVSSGGNGNGGGGGKVNAPEPVERVKGRVCGKCDFWDSNKGGNCLKLETTAERDSTVAEECKEFTPAPKSKLAVHFSSASAEHYTPQDIIQAALQVMGSIDLDPCSNSHDEPNVWQAGQHYTEADDGLSKEWGGKVWLNPPYGRPLKQWVPKVVEEFQAGRVEEALVLLPARPDTSWFQAIRDFPVCFVVGRITFVGSEDPAPFPSAVAYLGPNIAKFHEAFSGHGDIWQRIEPGMFGEDE